ncbi:hypothetical protein CC80DRAFT_257656 [Byssothecium circinans]|uniref:Uncharacterized protein n=1 Tax=Byssothecium circinans TaxID=147558 RepID=A0A6A5TBI1_9PLEO|nr:hypothetical protein CC80DRAFT_257656 [Byssothecium circinans]
MPAQPRPLARGVFGMVWRDRADAWLCLYMCKLPAWTRPVYSPLSSMVGLWHATSASTRSRGISRGSRTTAASRPHIRKRGGKWAFINAFCAGIVQYFMLYGEDAPGGCVVEG